MVLYPWYPSLSKIVMIILFYFLCILCIIITILFAFLAFKKRKVEWLYVLNHYMVNTISSYLYIPAIGLLMLAMKCEYKDDIHMSSLLSGTQCFTGWHVGILVIGIQTSIIIFSLGTFYMIFIHETGIVFGCPQSVISIFPNLTFQMIRTFFVLIHTILPNVFFLYFSHGIRRFTQLFIL